MTTATTNAPALLAVIEAAGRAGVAVCLWGDPGIGKSSLIRALATNEGKPCETVLGSLREPSDFAGLPVVGEDGVYMEAPSWAKRIASAEDGAYLFLDELSTSTPSVQKAMLAVVLDRTVGDLHLPANTRVIAAANDPERAADGWDLAPPLANRFLHVDYNPTTTDWLDGIVSNFPVPTPEPLNPLNNTTRAIARAKVAGFLRTRPELLHDFPTSDETATGRAWPSRRTWTMLADIFAQTTTDTAADLAAAGLVGPGAAVEFLTWLAHADQPDPEAIIADPESIDWHALTPDRAWAALSGVVALSTQGTKAAWAKGWKPLAVAAEHDLASVAAACARAMLLARPEGAMPPASVKRFAPALTEAGLL
ncbi:ATP-binding protein [Ornithinimicrobium murale]|uniref:ATP-binding protein n=1 Tax=Ornithinimicrobium murale TaxID=1050153 RepID=UPI000E0CCE6C|nr:AAA family ATPase [Ornithinimicrobium murale]